MAHGINRSAFIIHHSNYFNYYILCALVNVPPRLRVPTLRVPRLRVPRLRAPGLRAPRLRVPRVRVPRLKAPRLRAPRLRIPRLRVPRLRVVWISLLSQRYHQRGSQNRFIIYYSYHFYDSLLWDLRLSPHCHPGVPRTSFIIY